MTSRVLAPGAASGRAAVLREPLSLWGGVDPTSGLISDPNHPQHGTALAGRVVVMPAARGSSSSSSVLAELARGGVAPAAFVLGEPDHILAVGAAVAEELYGVRIPIVVVPAASVAAVRDGAQVEIGADGRLTTDARP